MRQTVGTVSKQAEEPARRREGPPGAERALRRFLAGPAWLLALTVGVLALTVELVGAWSPSLWTDEAVTISAARMSWADLWAFVQTVDAVHGTYYAAMKPWLALAGTSAVALRLPSAVAVALAVSMMFLLGRRLAGVGTGLLVATVLALLPRVTWAAIEGRSYAATVCVAVSATLLAAHLAERPRLTRALAYAVLMAAGAWVNAYLLLLLPA
ncbi:MAG: glycosyltransferase family 39 protein, partial [Lapillicoccus sp.]